LRPQGILESEAIRDYTLLPCDTLQLSSNKKQVFINRYLFEIIDKIYNQQIFIICIIMQNTFSFSSKIRILNDGKHKWSRYFITVPQTISQEIKKISDTMPRKWRWSVKVSVRIWFITRETSVFPSNNWATKKIGIKNKVYLLPIKSQIRKELHIQAEDELFINLELI